MKQTFKLARCRCRPSHQEVADCPQYAARPEPAPLDGPHYFLATDVLDECGRCDFDLRNPIHSRWLNAPLAEPIDPARVTPTVQGYWVTGVQDEPVVRCLFCGYHDGRHGDDCDDGGQNAEERRASWNTWRNANMPGGE